MEDIFSYIPGKQIDKPYPFGRYLPPLPSGVAIEWLSKNLPDGGLILDPFGSSPNLVVEIASAGYPVIVAANNPISRFLIEMVAIPPDEAQINAALAELATASKGSERIEPFIRSLYLTECTQCGRQIEADTFLWEKDATTPYGRIIHCQYCGESGERPVTQSDIENAARYSSSTLHHARALERIAPPRHPDRIHAEEAVSVYLPRALYALFTLVNKLDALNVSPDDKKLIDALMLTTFDQSNSLWGYPTSRERPKSLSLPSRFRENNIWMSLEKSINLWGKDQSSGEVKLANWPDTSIDPKTIYLFDGRLRDLIENLEHQTIKAVVTALPRPNQAFWSLSALWAGWLWGREAIGPFISVLKRRRYDWNWHTTALYAAFKHLSKVMNDGTSMFGYIGEIETGFIAAALIAANNAGFRLSGLASRFESGQGQLVWQYSVKPPKTCSENELRKLALIAGKEYLKQRGEPASYLRMTTSSIVGIYQDRTIRHPQSIKGTEIAADQNRIDNSSTSPSQDYTYIQSLIRGLLINPVNFRRYKESESVESGYWGMHEESEYQIPLSDRLEKIIVEFLVKNNQCTMEEIDRVSCDKFPGLLTPPTELVHICMESYAMQDTENNEYWQLREEDIPQNRQKDLKNTYEQIKNLGDKLGFRIITKTGKNNRQIICWTDDENKEIYTFYPIVSAIIGDIILDSKITSENPIIVLPGGRANLVAYKINRNPRFAEKTKPVTTGLSRWRFLKFRHLRWILGNPLLTPENLNEQLDLDPLTYTTPQLRLL